MFKLPSALLWIPSFANGYVAFTIIQCSWKMCGAQWQLESALLIEIVSLPISVIMLFGLVILSVMRSAVRQSEGAWAHIGALTVSALNIAAPVLLWYLLK